MKIPMFKLIKIFIILLVKYISLVLTVPQNEIILNQTLNSNEILSRSFLVSEQRPLYNIAHMCNSIKKTLDHLNRGANAIEVDITFKMDDVYLYHGYPCDCFRFCWDRELLSKYLSFVREATTPGHPKYKSRFTILYFDLKLNSFTTEEKYQQGIRFANYLAVYFFNEIPMKTTIRLITAISYGDDFNFIIGFVEKLKELNLYESIKDYIGFDVGIDKDVEKIREVWRRLNITNVWQGEGITNCFNPITGHQLEKLVRIRDSEYSYFTKVYRWTIDLTDSIKLVLQYHIDGIMTNHPERVFKIVTTDPDFSQLYRLATIHDNPFKKFTTRFRSVGKSRTDYRNKILTALNDLKDSFRYYIRDIFTSIF